MVISQWSCLLYKGDDTDDMLTMLAHNSTTSVWGGDKVCSGVEKGILPSFINIQ